MINEIINYGELTFAVNIKSFIVKMTNEIINYGDLTFKVNFKSFFVKNDK